jgi:hypothetical protein
MPSTIISETLSDIWSRLDQSADFVECMNTSRVANKAGIQATNELYQTLLAHKEVFEELDRQVVGILNLNQLLIEELERCEEVEIRIEEEENSGCESSEGGSQDIKSEMMGMNEDNISCLNEVEVNLTSGGD